MTYEEIQPGPPCPACGGAGGGPFGRAGSAWDTEAYVCPRCEGLGYLLGEVAAAEVPDADAPSVPRPGIVKTTPPARVAPEKKRRTSRG